ncbi:MAG: hypothetical protein MIO93_16945 [ANME-2 cluster archaeon]|nr:hypothetical protein [ANME-2 cluster archaeon]
MTIEGWMGTPDWTYLADYSYISEVKGLKDTLKKKLNRSGSKSLKKDYLGLA